MNENKGKFDTLNKSSIQSYLNHHNQTEHKFAVDSINKSKHGIVWIIIHHNDKIYYIRLSEEIDLYDGDIGTHLSNEDEKSMKHFFLICDELLFHTARLEDNCK